MGVVTRKVSDITGKEGPDEAFYQVVVRQHPKVEQAKRLDVLPDELSSLKGITDLVILEVRLPSGDTADMHVPYADFAKLVPDEVVQSAPGTRGRPQGFRPNGG